MLIKTINDTELLKRKIINELPYLLTYLFFCRITNDCLYVGMTKKPIGIKKWRYIMSHHTIKSFRKNIDKYYLQVIFPNDIPYIGTNYYEGFFIKIYNAKFNRGNYEMGCISTSDKHKIPYLEYMKPKPEKKTTFPINRCELLEMFLQISYKDIYDKIYNIFHGRGYTDINKKYDILKFCNFKDFDKSFNLIHNNIDLKHDEIVYLFLKHKLLNIDLWSDRVIPRHYNIPTQNNQPRFFSSLVRNYKRFKCVDKEYTNSLILRPTLETNFDLIEF